MYPITQDVLNLFIDGYRQIIDISVFGQKSEFHITEKDILTNGFSVNRYCASGNRIQIGSVAAASMTIRLDNREGRFDNVTFEGAEMYVRVGIKKWDAHHWENAQIHYIPFGYFSVDNAPRKMASITLSALDRMVLFDRDADFGMIAFPITVSEMVRRICTLCNVPLVTNPSVLPNGSYIVQTPPDGSNITYRQLLAWCCEILGVCAYIDWTGGLVLSWYEETDAVLQVSDRFSSDVFEESVTITGIRIEHGDSTVLVGDDSYIFDIDQNPLIQHNESDVANALSAALVGFTYTPFKATILPCPHYWPLDRITFVDKSDAEIPSIITNYTFSLNGGTSIEGKGLSDTRNGYARLNPFTQRENAIMRQQEDARQKYLSQNIASVLALNELICNAMGVYRTPVVQPDGSTIYYLHDAQALEDSQTIFTMTASGIAWTSTGWNDGSPQWSYGVTAAGDALFRMLSAEGINVSRAGEDYNIEITPSAFRIYYRNMLVTNIEADQMTIPRAKFSTYAECGKVRMVPYGDQGANLIFVS